MEPKNPDERPESPKKKIRPSSTTNSEVVNSDSVDATDPAQLSDNHTSEMNGSISAPTRRGREAEALASSGGGDSPTTENDQASIQEEVVSSSENTVHSKQKLPSSNEGDADSPTNEAEDLSNHGAGATVPSRDNEAEREEL